LTAALDDAVRRGLPVTARLRLPLRRAGDGGLFSDHRRRSVDERGGRRCIIDAMAGSENSLVTGRLEVRHPVEADRPRFVELFCDEAFMVFSGGALSEVEANTRFDGMVARCLEVSFAKQPIVERASGLVVGYTGVDWIDFGGRRWLEWGYRLVTVARGKGYATEASGALLAVAAECYTGEILGLIHPENGASKGVIAKLGFEYWKRAPVLGEVRDVFRLRV
jgi:RimJ/RimL family protein N-acetyltransferase